MHSGINAVVTPGPGALPVVGYKICIEVCAAGSPFCIVILV